MFKLSKGKNTSDFQDVEALVDRVIGIGMGVAVLVEDIVYPMELVKMHVS